MKIAFISDIHGNFKALEAVFDDISGQDVDKVVCLGDVATLGPQPRQVLKKLRVLGIECVKGNHDEAIFDIDNLEKYKIPPLLSETMKWCFKQLNDEELSFLNSFKPSIKIAIDNQKFLLAYHGTLNSNSIGIFPETSEYDIESFIPDSDISVMVGGHTHLQMDKTVGKTRIVSVGSVGCPFAETPDFGDEPILLPEAHYTIVVIDDNHIFVDQRAIDFDVESYKQILIESDLPSKDWWLRQY